MIERAPLRVRYVVVSKDSAIRARVDELLAAMVAVALHGASEDPSVDVAT